VKYIEDAGVAEPGLVTEMLETQNRKLAGPPSPAKHLTLEHVEYEAPHPLDRRFSILSSVLVVSCRALAQPSPPPPPT